MAPESQSARQLALHVLGCELRGGAAPAPGEIIAAAERVLERLREQLVQWFGTDGFHALLGRAVNRASASHPLLAAVNTGARTGRFLGPLSESTAPGDATVLREALAHLIDCLFSLLARLIGDDLVGRLALQIWPEDGPGRGVHSPHSPNSPHSAERRIASRE